MKAIKFTCAATAMAGLAACNPEAIIETGLSPHSNATQYLAVANDQGRDSSTNIDDNAAIAITPDGCQAWVIDDGIEGRASNRLDPVTGLPICGVGEPGAVYGSIHSGTEGVSDYIPATPLPTTTETVTVRPVGGHYHTSHQH